MIKMSKKELAITVAIILLIFAVGFVLRVESTHLTGIPADEKAYYEDQNGLPYMYELDSYYNYRMTKDYIDHGYLGDTRVNGQNWDLHSYFPPGRSAEYPPLIVYVATLLYKFVNLFGSVPLIVTCFWLPAFIGPLAGVVAYLFVRNFTNEYGAVAAGILTTIVPIYFFRTVPGWFDTDMFNVLFPILIMWLITEAACTEDNKKIISLTILASFSTLLFALAWEGWFYVFYMIIISLLTYITVSKIRGFKTGRIWKILGLFAVFTILFTIPTGVSDLGLLVDPVSFMSISNQSVWPNVYVSVSELEQPSIEEALAGVGPAFLGGILGLLWIFRVLINKKLKKRFLNRMTWFLYSLLVVWTFVGIFFLKEGVRFLMILVPPMVVSSGIMVGIAVDYLSLLKKSERFPIFRRRKNLIKTLAFCILLVVTVPAILNVYVTFSTLEPSANDDLWDVAIWINNNTSNDTVIVSKWDYGHFLTAVADRPVSVDGGSQNSPRVYWINRAFVTDNESLSLGIFNMIATSGDLGPVTLDKYTGNTTKSVEILNSILSVDRGTAEAILINNYGLNQTAAKDVLQYTHPANPHHFVVLTYGLNGVYWIFHFGSWDFNKMQGGNYKYSYGDIKIVKGTLNTTNNITMDLKTGNVTWNGKTPYCVINVTNGTVEKRYIDGNSNFCIVFIMESMQSVVIDKQFENSTFTKLWLERSNSNLFKAVYENRNATVWESKS